MDSLLPFLLSLAEISISITLVALICAGWGYWLGRWMKLDNFSNIGLTQLWLGFISLNLAANIIHLFLPINWVITLIFGILGAIGLLKIPKTSIASFLKQGALFFSKNKKISLFAAFIYIVWCVQMLSGEINYDAGMYYLSSIKWLNEYPIVPGLANLFAQFGFNHTYFSFVALLNSYPYAVNHFGLGGLFLLCLTSASLISANFQREKFGWFLLLILFCSLQVSGQLLASPAPDMVVGFLEIAIFAYVLQIILLPKKNEGNADIAVLVFLLSVQVTTIKLSAAIFALGSIALAVPTLYRSLKIDRALVIKTFSFGVLIFTIHIIRGYILSGYPLFPSTAFGLTQLDWLASTQDAQNAAKVIYDYARNEGLPPGQWQTGWKWLPYWWNQQIQNHGQWILSIFALLGANLFIIISKNKRYNDLHLTVLYIPLISAVIFWFLTAPAWRFLGVIPYLLIGISLWLCLRSLSENYPHIRIFQYPRQNIFIPILVIGGLISLNPIGLHINGWRELPGVLVDKNPDHPVPEVIIENKLTDSGLNVVFVPWFQCWNAPLPCTPLFNSKLHLRSFSQEKSHLSSGFSVRQNGEELRPKYQSTLENGIEFNKPGYPNFLTSVSGIGNVENWGRWTIAKEARFRFLYPLPVKFDLEISAIGFGPNINRETYIDVCGQQEKIIPSDHMKQFQLGFDLKKSCSDLSIAIFQPISPHEINPADSDMRKLGIGIESLKIKERN